MIRVSRVLKLWVLLVCLIGAAFIPVYGIEGEKNLMDLPPGETPAPEDSHKISKSSGDGIQKESGPETPLVKQLQERMRELDAREQRLLEKEQRIEALRRDIEALAKQQQKLAAETAEADKKRKQFLEKDPTRESLARLIKVYEAMDSEEAALRIGKMKERLALDILAGIKPQKAAGMLAGVEPAKAARLSEGLRFYSKDHRNRKQPVKH